MQDKHDGTGIQNDQEESKAVMDPTYTIVPQPITSQSQSQISETGEQILSGNASNCSKNIEEVQFEDLEKRLFLTQDE